MAAPMICPMGFRFRRSIRVAPGVRVNVGKRGISSVSAGAGGLRYTQPVRSRRTPEAEVDPLESRASRLGDDELARRRRINTRILLATGWALALIALLVIPTIGPWLALTWAVFGAWRLLASRS